MVRPRSLCLLLPESGARTGRSSRRKMMSTRLFRTLITVTVFVASTAVLGLLARSATLQGRLSWTARPEGSPVTRIDKQGYLAGEAIKISGSGFAPFERVMLRVSHADGTVEAGMGHEPWFVSADASGSFKTSWSLNGNDTAGVNLVLEASGSSGSTTRTTFVRRGRLTTDRPSYRSGER